MEMVGIAEQGASKTQIAFRASLNFSQLNKYLSLLLHNGLLETVVEGCSQWKRNLQGHAKRSGVQREATKSVGFTK